MADSITFTSYEHGASQPLFGPFDNFIDSDLACDSIGGKQFTFVIEFISLSLTES